jgi:hypothetical protein
VSPAVGTGNLDCPRLLNYLTAPNGRLLRLLNDDCVAHFLTFSAGLVGLAGVVRDSRYRVAAAAATAESLIHRLLRLAALAGVYAPVELLCKDENGEVVPYLQGHSVKWEDGSMQADLPMQRLSELFNVNHFIVSSTRLILLFFSSPPDLLPPLLFLRFGLLSRLQVSQVNPHGTRVTVLFHLVRPQRTSELCHVVCLPLFLFLSQCCRS